LDVPKQQKLSFMYDDADVGLYSGREIGTFKDSLRAPVFRWFRYPAGYSYKFVLESFDIFDVQPGDWVYDPFSGTGTTLLCAKQREINGYGVEAHSFVHWVASVKLNWDFDYQTLLHYANDTVRNLKDYLAAERMHVDVDGVFPSLIYRCYHPDDLRTLYLIRRFIELQADPVPQINLLKLALTDTLRGAAVAGTGWPYISPKDNPEDYDPKQAFEVFTRTLWQMVEDLQHFIGKGEAGTIINQLGDARVQQPLADAQCKIAVTSPPYLNNYDYADRTRLETYFWGITHSWAEITEKYRDKLMVAATTQIRRGQFDVETVLSYELKAINPVVHHQLQQIINQLSQRRLKKSGKKDYDLMAGLYFNDMLKVLKETYRILQSGGHFCLVLGDSAPYGVHIPTDKLIGDLALSIGFSEYQYHHLRTRGKKWKANPQRHKVPLREGIVILRK
jgi:DNA modification methylase